MQHGNAGLSKRRSNLAHKEVEKSDAAVASWEALPSRSSNLHVVEVDRVIGADRLKAIRTHSSQTADLLAERKFYRAFKRVLDIVGASLAIILLSPLFLGIAAYSYKSGGSPLFRHSRVGRNGVAFDCFKFRTMVKNAEQVLQDLLDSNAEIRDEWMSHHKLKDDPRVTKFGRFLRRSSLDELPQLWNVLRGDMSLVGPRPIVSEEVDKYGSKAKAYLSVQPGITGLWQVSGRNDMTFHRRIAMDVYYVRSRCIALDIYIIAKTLPAVFATNGAY